MITKIGITAGDIWQYLDTNEDATLQELSKALSVDQEIILMSLGWLAREGHISLGDTASGFRSSLNLKHA